jgi:hypothetical protein
MSLPQQITTQPSHSCLTAVLLDYLLLSAPLIDQSDPLALVVQPTPGK